MSEEEKKVIVNGKEEKPIPKTKLPLEVDWQELARKKLEELQAKK